MQDFIQDSRPEKCEMGADIVEPIDEMDSEPEVKI
jgi:hypothetical protein